MGISRDLKMKLMKQEIDRVKAVSENCRGGFSITSGQTHKRAETKVSVNQQLEAAEKVSKKEKWTQRTGLRYRVLINMI